jgi:alpha-galactosidase
VGPDVALRFDDVPYMRIFHPERISTKVTLQNTIFRSPMNGHMFLNDPDVFLLRDDNIRLSKRQRESLSKINALFGSMLMTSDNIGAYDPAKKALLEETLELFYEGRVTGYSREGRLIRINYELHGEEHTLLYDFNRGTVREEQEGRR